MAKKNNKPSNPPESKTVDPFAAGESSDPPKVEPGEPKSDPPAESKVDEPKPDPPAEPPADPPEGKAEPEPPEDWAGIRCGICKGFMVNDGQDYAKCKPCKIRIPTIGHTMEEAFPRQPLPNVSRNARG